MLSQSLFTTICVANGSKERLSTRATAWCGTQCLARRKSKPNSPSSAAANAGQLRTVWNSSATASGVYNQEQIQKSPWAIQGPGKSDSLLIVKMIFFGKTPNNLLHLLNRLHHLNYLHRYPRSSLTRVTSVKSANYYLLPSLCDAKAKHTLHQTAHHTLPGHVLPLLSINAVPYPYIFR